MATSANTLVRIVNPITSPACMDIYGNVCKGEFMWIQVTWNWQKANHSKNVEMYKGPCWIEECPDYCQEFQLWNVAVQTCICMVVDIIMMIYSNTLWHDKKLLELYCQLTQHNLWRIMFSFVCCFLWHVHVCLMLTDSAYIRILW